MSNHKTRLAKLEKTINEQSFNAPQIVEVWGTRVDGTKYLIETWRQFIEADKVDSPQWERFIEDGLK